MIGGANTATLTKPEYGIGIDGEGLDGTVISVTHV